MTKQTINVHMMLGLPGAGKSTHVKKMTYDDNNALVISMDKYIDENTNQYKPFDEILANCTRYTSLYRMDKVYVDGFLPDEESREKVIKSIVANFQTLYNRNTIGAKKELTYKFIFHVWPVDVEACVYNDKFRNRYKSAIKTIETYAETFQLVTKRWLNKMKYNYTGQATFSTEVIIHKTEKAAVYDGLFSDMAVKVCKDDYDVQYNNTRSIIAYKSEDAFITSAKWTDDDSEPLTNFDEFDEVIFKINPNISYLLYKKIYKESGAKLVSWNQYDDYYSTTATRYHQYQVNIHKLFNVLKKYNLVSEEENIY